MGWYFAGKPVIRQRTDYKKGVAPDGTTPFLLPLVGPLWLSEFIIMSQSDLRLPVPGVGGAIL